MERFQVLLNEVTQRNAGQNNDRMEEGNTERQVKHPPVPRPTALDTDVTYSRFLSWRQDYNDYATLQKLQDATMKIQRADFWGRILKNNLRKST